MLQPFVGRNIAKEEKELVLRGHSQPLPGLCRCQSSVRHGAVETERNHPDPGAGHSEVGLQFMFHSFGMHEEMVRQMILNPQGHAVEQGVVVIPSAGVHVMGGEHDLFAERLVVEHQHGAIKEV